MKKSDVQQILSPFPLALASLPFQTQVTQRWRVLSVASPLVCQSLRLKKAFFLVQRGEVSTSVPFSLA